MVERVRRFERVYGRYVWRAWWDLSNEDFSATDLLVLDELMGLRPAVERQLVAALAIVEAILRAHALTGTPAG